jgi:hypothetical protein
MHRSFPGLFALCVLLMGLQCSAQLDEIDTKKLPQDATAAYAKVLPYEHYVQGWSDKWNYDVPRKEVVSALRSALTQLAASAKAAPENHELQVLTGLVAHYAYNVDVNDSYDSSVHFLQLAVLSDSSDIRPNWFLGLHQCQANQGDLGMPRLIAVEESRAWRQLPPDFWDAYVTCSMLTLMPAHALRAIDHTTQLGASPDSMKNIVDIENKRYKPSDATATYPAHDAWVADRQGDDVTFTTRLCGVSFTAHGNWGSKLLDVQHGTCTAIFEPPEYPAKHGKSSPSILLLARPAKAQEVLSDFVGDFLKGRYADAKPTTLSYCPSTHCLSYEIIVKDMYESEGGGHMLAVAFERDAPAYDGIIFEQPWSPPKPDDSTKSKGPVYYRPDMVFHRLPGKIYYLVILDSNASIFAPASKDYDFFLHSIRLE